MQSCNTGEVAHDRLGGRECAFHHGRDQTNPATVTPGQVLGLQGFTTSAASTARMTAVTNLLGFDNGLDAGGGVECDRKLGHQPGDGAQSGAGGRQGAHDGVPELRRWARNWQEVAKIINVRTALGMNRQIFFAFLGGFDTHDLELTNQAAGLDDGEPGDERLLQCDRGDGRQTRMW